MVKEDAAFVSVQPEREPEAAVERPLRLYSERSLAPDGHVTLLDPFWGAPEVDPRDPLCGRFDEYYRVASELFELTELHDADIGLLPFDYGQVLLGRRSHDDVASLLQRVVAAGKRLLVFCWHDSSDPLPLPEEDTTVFRTAIDRSRRRQNEFCLPTFHEDFVAKYCGGTLPLREYRKMPTVSFCGRASVPRPIWQRGREELRRVKQRLLGRDITFPYGELRLRAMQKLTNDSDIHCNFITHSAFWGGLGDDARTSSVDKRVVARGQYIDNMMDSDYVLCVRGAGNFSMRLYETLCMGRVPIILDTDSAFPFDDEVDWGSLGLRVPGSRISCLATDLLSFHRKLSPASHAELQLRCRDLWVTRLCPQGFFRQLSSHARDTDRRKGVSRPLTSSDSPKRQS